MADQNLEQYKNRVEQLGKSLLDVVSSVALGDFDVKVDIPEDIEVFADLAVGLEFMIEDLRELSVNQERTRAELEMQIAQRTHELENGLDQTKTSQSQAIVDGWQEYSEPRQGSKNFTLDREKGLENAPTWLPEMDQAVINNQLSHTKNGHDTESLSLPLKLQDEVIGVIGFNRKSETPWTNREIATVEAIAEQVSLALENQRLFDQTQSALAEADTLYQASAELNTAQNYADILQVIQKFSALGQVSQQIHLALFNDPTSESDHPNSITIIAGIPEDQQQELPRSFHIGDRPFLEAQATMSPDHITTLNDIPNHPHLPQEIKDVMTTNLNTNSVSFIPLVVGGQWIGFFDCTYGRSVEFTEDEIRRTAAIAAQASVAVQNLRSIEVAEQRAIEAQQRSRELAIINKVVSSVTAAKDMNESLKIISEELTNAVHVDETSIALLNEEQNQLTQVAFRSLLPSLPSMEGGIIPLANNPEVAQVINYRKPLLISNINELGPSSPIYKLMDYRKYSKILIMPLSSGAEIIGTINMGIQSQTDTIDQNEMRMAETILLQASTAIQNARLLEQTQEALTETASLYQANKDLNAIASAADILKVLQKHTLLGQKSNFCGLFLFDSSFNATNTPETITPIAQSSVDEQIHLADEPITFSEWPNHEEFMSSQEMLTIHNIESDNRLFGKFREFFHTRLNAEMVVSAPLTIAGRWIGHIYASYPKADEFTENDVTRLVALIGQAAISVNNIELLEETAKRANQLETAAEIAQQASSTLDTTALLNRAVNLIRDRFDFYHSSIFLLEGMSATVAASTGEAGKQLVENKHSLELREGASIIGHVCFTGEPLIVNDVTQNPTHRPHPLLPDTKAELGIPLKIGNRVTGALDVQSTQANAFTQDDLAVLQTLADQIAIALDNSRSFEVAQQALVEVREADRLKTEFLANMSHELRTPLNSIIGFSRVILKGIDGPINDLQQQDLEAIHHSGQHLLDMINNILDISKIEAGKMELNIEEIEITDVVESVISAARGLVKEKPIRLLSNIPDNLPKVNADRTRVRQILLNLLQNASKFTDEGEISVNVEHLEEERLLRFSVSDSGIGIAPEDQSKLFERFSQVDSSLTRKVGGTGLGLSISKLLVEMQGGTIDLHSELGKGTTFWFTIPVASLVEETSNINLEEINPNAKIIISIDDDAKVIDLYKRYLRSHGFQVVPITNPQDVLKTIKQVRPYAITLDIMMPYKDGWQVIQEIKEDPETADIPIIICSIVEERDRAYQLGAVDYLVKPILEDELVNAITRLDLPKDKDFNEILVIDDDANVFQLIEIALRNEAGFKLAYANGGFAGLEILQKNPPDAIILDLMMPDLDGFSILETMQGDTNLRNLPVIILTAADLTEEDRKRLEQNKRAVLRKDEFKTHQLIDFLENALQLLQNVEKD